MPDDISYTGRDTPCKKCEGTHPLQRYGRMFYYYFCPEVKRVLLVSEDRVIQMEKGNGTKIQGQ